MDDALTERVEALERAVTDGDHDLSALADDAEALDRLDALAVDRVYPGHGPVHGDLSGVVERHRASLDERLDRIRELIGSGYSTVPGVAAALAGERDVRYLIPEAMGALAHLERHGVASVELVDGVRQYDA